ncbi:amino acid adenylation domain-containing protein [Microbulbifer echini]|uniref:Amino acid adenylation domain-containing protein n=1 Tax=Microbulbifer echini TaxID=1529067 RepID=A0ABV4NSQ8_9GAMM
MDKTAEVIRILNVAGIHLYVAEGKLKAKAKKGKLKPQFVEMIREHKVSLQSFLENDSRGAIEIDDLAKIVPVVRSSDLLPVSDTQRRLWFLDRMGDGAEYIMPGALKVSGKFDVDIAEQSFHIIIDRHESLRTIFVEVEGEPYQQVLKDNDFYIRRLDFSGLSDAERSQQIKDLIESEGVSLFDLSQDLMLRVSYAKVSPIEGVLTFSMHHIASDGHSTGVLLREFATLYEKLTSNKGWLLPDLPVQYVDYAIWQRTYLKSERVKTQLNFWESNLQEIPAVHTLPLDKPRSKKFNTCGSRYVINLDRQLSLELKKIARENNVTLFMLLHAAFSVLLAKYSSSSDIVIGTPVANRGSNELENLIGFFANTIILRTTCTSEVAFSEYLNEVKKVNLDALNNQEVPIDQLVERLCSDRNTGYMPLFQIMFSMNNTQSETLNLPDVELEFIESQTGHSKFELLLNAVEVDDSIRLTFEFDTELFLLESVVRMAVNLQCLLKDIVVRVDCPIGHLNYIDDNELKLIHKLDSAPEFNSTTFKSICSQFESQVQNRPNQIAVSNGNEFLTFAQLNEHSNQLGCYLRENGVKENVLVGLLLNRSIDIIVAIFSIWKAGGAYVPLDPSSSSSRLDFLLKDSGVELLITHKSLQNRVKGVSSITVDDAFFKAELAQCSTANLTIYDRDSSKDLAYGIYTSGSTGQPKAALIQNESLTNLANNIRDWGLIKEGDVWGWVSSYAFDASLQSIIQLAGGVSLVIVDEDIKREGAKLRRLISKFNIQVMDCTPSLLESWFSQNLASCLPNLVIGGEEISQDLWHRLVKWKTLHERSAINVYGPTECCVNSTYSVIEGEYPNIGIPLNNVRVKVLDVHRSEVPLGAVGELYIGGHGLAKEYLNRQDLTSQRFVSMVPKGERYYRTGDLVRLRPSGELIYVGRIDDQIKIRGYRVELGEIEYHLISHEHVETAVVMYRELTEGQKYLIAYVVFRHPELVGDEVEEIKSTLANELPSYMHPSFYVKLDKIPLTSNGKVDKKALPEPSRIESHSRYVKPEGKIQKRLVNIWSDLLQLPTDKIGANSNFFTLGGHSLLSVRLIAAVRVEFGVELAVREIFECPILAEFARCIDQTQESALRPQISPSCDIVGPIPLSFAQQRLWFIDQLEGGSPHYNMFGAFSVTGSFSEEAAEEAFTRIISRHHSLRTVFVDEGQGVEQRIQDSDNFSLVRSDLSHFFADQRFEKIQQQLSKEQNRIFDLAHDLMLRAGYIHTAEDEGVLYINMHHIAADGWSIGLLVKEFGIQYEAILAGMSDQLPSLPFQYTDYASWQRNWFNSEAFTCQLEYWDEQLRELPLVHNLPLDYTRPQKLSQKGKQVCLTLDKHNGEALKAFALESGVTLFMLLHGAFALLLSRHSGQSDIVVGTPVAGRLQQELEEMIGFFVNTLVLRLNCNLEQTLSTYLQQVKQVNLDAQANQDVPFEHLVERLNPERSTQYSPLFQVLFTMDNNERTNLELPRTRLCSFEQEDVQAKFELTLSVTDKESGLGFQFDYNNELFDEGHIRQLAAQLMIMLTNIPLHGNDKLERIPLVEPSVQMGLRGEVVPVPSGHIQQHFEEKAVLQPDVAAIVWQGQAISYGELNRQANKLANLLRNKGVVPESKVGLCLPRTPRLVIAILAVLKAGGAYVPLDPAYPKTRLKFMLQDSGTSLVLGETESQSLLDNISVDVLWLDRCSWQEQSPEAPAVERDGRQLAYLIYTSGSTGRPKGVLVEHLSLLNLNHVEIQDFKLGCGDRLLHCISFNFDPATGQLFAGLNSGATIYLVDLQSDLTTIIRDQNITHAILPAAVLAAEREQLLPSLKVIGTGGETCPLNVARYWSIGRTYFNLYGPTECTITSLRESYVGRVDRESIGRPIANSYCYIFDEIKQLVAPGAIGELYIGGVGLARGYYNRPDLDFDRFILNPNNESERLYRTGDLVRELSDGRLEFIGRADEQVKIRGFRIELGEIEAALLDLNRIKSAVVLVRDDLPGQLVAYLCPVENANGEELVTWVLEALQSRLPTHMIPAAFSVLEELPLTVNGKLDKSALPKPALLSCVNFLAPENEFQRILAGIWADLLGLEYERISLNDNFFALGGHSLLSVRLVNLIEDKLNVRITVQDVFSARTLRQLSVLVATSGAGSSEVRLTPRDRNIVELPLSFAQQQLWFLNELSPDSTQYNMFHAFKISGDFDVVVANRAINKVIKRHEILRTCFYQRKQGPIQVVREEFDVSFQITKLNRLSPEEQDAVILETIKLESSNKFDLQEDLLLRGSILEFSSSYRILLLTLHHIAADGWSMRVLFDEFSHIYTSLKESRSSELKELDVQYGDYAIWQRRYMEGATLAQKLKFWEQKLVDAPPIHSLPTDRIRASGGEKSTGIFYNGVNSKITTSLKLLAEKNEATLFMLLQAGLSLHIGRCSNESDIVIGAPSVSRNNQLLDSMVGLFLNTQVFRAQFLDNPSFNELIARCRNEHLEAISYADVPLELIVEHLSPERSTEFTPIFQILINMDNIGGEAAGIPGLEIEALKSAGEIEHKYDLTLYINENIENNSLSFRWVYDANLFDEATIKTIANEFEFLLSYVVGNPEAAVFSIPWKNGHGWSGAALSRTNEKFESIIDVFEENAEIYANKPAIIMENMAISYGDLNQKANQLANYLFKQFDIRSTHKVAIATSRSIDRVVSIWAILKLGAAYVPLTSELPANRLSYILEDCGAKVILTDLESIQWVQDLAPNVELITLDHPSTVTEYLSFSSDKPVCSEIRRGTVAHLIYTSGSTGRPKGVLGTHGATQNRVAWMLNDFPFGEEEIACHITSMAFVRAVWELFVPMCAGVPLVLFKRDTLKNTPEFILQLQRTKVSRIVTAPSLLRAMCRAKESFSAELTSLKYWFVSGEAFSIDLSKRSISLFKGVKFFNLYGSTEVLSDVLYSSVTGEESGISVPLGRPIQGVNFDIVDRSGNSVPGGMVGELLISGASVNSGYNNQISLTNSVFGESSQGRTYRTGDLVRLLSSGQVIYVGRSDHQIKIRGYRIELGDVESTMSTLSDVKDAAVKVWGGGDDKYLAGYVVLRSDISVSVNFVKDDIRRRLGELLPGYMVPTRLAILDVMPITPNGKIDRKALTEPNDLGEEYLAPKTEIERFLATIWSSLLKVDVENIGQNANFFSLGGHSLLSVQLVAEVSDKFNVKLSVREVFETPELHLLASIIENSENNCVDSKVEPVDRDAKHFDLSLPQQRLWFIDQLEGGGSQYNIPLAIKISGQFNINFAEVAFAALISRHEILRVNYIDDGDGAKQVISEYSPFFLKYINFGNESRWKIEEKIDATIKSEISRVFDLTADLMLRATFIKSPMDYGVLIINVHHIAADGRSMRILAQEFLDIYQAIGRGEAPRKVDLPLQYIDYAVWQKQMLLGDKLSDLRNFWKAQLLGIPQVHNLSLDFVRPITQRYSGKTIHRLLDNKLLANLKGAAEKYNITLFMLLHGSFAYLLSRLSNDHDIVLGTPVANRSQKEIESVVGFFVNTLVLRLNCDGSQSLHEYFSQVKKVNLDALSHQELTFEQLVDLLKPERSTAYSPLFQIMLSMDTNSPVEAELEDISVEFYEFDRSVAKYDLTLNVSELRDGLQLSFEYNTDLFVESRIQRMAEQLEQLLQNISSCTEGKLGELSCISSSDLNRINGESVGPGVSERDHAILDLFTLQSSRFPRQHAVTFSKESLDYGELYRRSNRLADDLIRSGISEGSFVAICMNQSIEMIVAVLAVLRSGAAYVPLDPNYPRERLEFMLKDSSAGALLTQSHLVGKFDFDVDNQFVLDLYDWVGEGQAEFIAPKRSRKSPVYAIYTSGTTGIPKGVVVNYGALSDHILAITKVLSMSDKDRVLQFASFSFDTFGEQVFAALTVGARVYLREKELWSGIEFSKFVDANKITITDLSPNYLSQLLLDDTVNSRFWNKSTLSRVVVGGEAPTIGLVRRWRELNIDKTCKLYNAYGPTEAVITTTIADITEAQSYLPLGNAVGNRKLYVLDENKNLLPWGAVGELYIGGGILAERYLNNDGKTADCFSSDPFSNLPKARLYKTGDLVRYLENGDLVFHGRTDDQVKLRGFRIELGEVEQKLSEHRFVSASVVDVRECPDGRKQLIAWVESTGFKVEGDFSLSECLRRFLKERLPDYMVPSMIIEVDEFNVLPNGKFDRKALRIPEDSFGLVGITEPKDLIETKLRAIWAQVLGVPISRVDTTKSFFEIGGDSILSLQLVSSAAKEGYQISVKQIFEHQTISALAPNVKNLNKAEVSQGLVSGTLNLIPIQSEFFQDETDLHHYNQSIVLKTPPGLNVENLKSILRVVFSKHDSFRLTFEYRDTNWIGRYKLEVEDLVSASVESYFFEDDSFSSFSDIAEQAQRSLSILDGPLIKAIFIENLSGEGRLLLIVHHLIIDGVSWRILLQDIELLWTQLVNNQPLSAGFKTNSFQDWALYLQKISRSPCFTDEIEYWSNLDMLDVGSYDEIKTVSEFSNVGFELPISESQDILLKAGEVYSSQINELLLTVLSISIKQWNGEDTVRFDIESHGRDGLDSGFDFSQTIGWFTSIYPIALEVTGDNLVKQLRAVKVQLNEVPSQGLGYGIYKYMLGRSLIETCSKSGILFNYLGQFDQFTKQNTHFSVASESTGTNVSPRRRTSHGITLTLIATGGKLRCNLQYNSSQYMESEAQKLVDLYRDGLRSLASSVTSVDPGPNVNPAGKLSELIVSNLADSCLIKLKHGANNSQIFCFHPLGGNVGCYTKLANSMNFAGTVYGVQAPAVTEEYRFSSFEELAGFYVRALINQHSGGDFHLVGWSLGGSLAYEVAVQLQNAGHKVGYVGLFDERPIENLSKSVFSWFDRIKGLFEDQFDWEIISTLDVDQGVDRLVNDAFSTGFVPQDLDRSMVHRYFNYLVDIGFALSVYRPAVAGIDLELYRVTGSDAELSDYGWSHYAKGEIIQIEVEGDHTNLVRDPYVRGLSEVFNRRLGEKL